MKFSLPLLPQVFLPTSPLSFPDPPSPALHLLRRQQVSQGHQPSRGITGYDKTRHIFSHQGWTQQPNRRRVPKAGKTIRDANWFRCKESHKSTEPHHHDTYAEDPGPLSSLKVKKLNCKEMGQVWWGSLWKECQEDLLCTGVILGYTERLRQTWAIQWDPVWKTHYTKPE